MSKKVAVAVVATLAALAFFTGLAFAAAKTITGQVVFVEPSAKTLVIDAQGKEVTFRVVEKAARLVGYLFTVPNSKLAESIVTNYYLPETRMSVLIPISVSYGSDPSKVEVVLTEEAARAVGEVPGLLAEPAPFVRFIPGFGESSLGFTLIVQVNEFVDQYLVQHELRKRILARFEKEGVEFPSPQRMVLSQSEFAQHRNDS